MRYTRSKDGSIIYATVLGRPEIGKQLLLKSFADTRIDGDLSVDKVSLLGSTDDVTFSKTKDGLSITVPQHVPDNLANVFKLDVTGSATVR